LISTQFPILPEYVKYVADDAVRQWQDFIMLNTRKYGTPGMKYTAWRRIRAGLGATSRTVSAVLR
jgi:hypothetical protein